jgi:phage terminase large subunit-like protein
MTGTLPILDSDQWYYDAESGERPERFFTRYLRHFEGKHTGQPFELHPTQKRIVRDLFGWKWRGGESAGLRRFTDCYLEGAIGSGKSPLLAGLGLYCLMADDEPGAQVWSIASTFAQTRAVFDVAKVFIKRSPELSRRLKVRQFAIHHPKSESSWRICSGDGPGAGCRPSLILGDEVHDWDGAGAYKDLHDRTAKRRQPLTICATNAPRSEVSFAYQLRQRAVAALDGEGDPTLYPVIWAAAEDAATDDPLAWRDANPLMGITINPGKVSRLIAEAMKDAAEEAEARRLYLGIMPKIAAGRWLDLELWDECSTEDPPPADAPLYVGLDLSQSDDLCAAAYVWVTPERFYVRSHFWLPLPTAEKYERQDSIPYQEWAARGHVTLFRQPTINSAAHRYIASAIRQQAEGYKLAAVCYDRYRAEEAVKALESDGLTCVPIAQGYSVSPGCHELDKRLKDGSILIERNPVLRFCAENCEVKRDDRGNIWPVKPGASGKYAGRRGAKIDGVSALVTALTEARKFVFPNTQRRARAWSLKAS